MDKLKPSTVTHVLLPCLAVGLMLAAACNGEQGREVTPTPEQAARPASTIRSVEAREGLLQEIVATINAYEGFGPGSFTDIDLTTRSCGDPTVEFELREPCLLLETSTISAAQAMVMVRASFTTAFWEITLENDGGEWRITSVKDLSG